MEILSTPLKELRALIAKCSNHCAVQAEQQNENLADFVRRVANEKGLSFREVARRGGLSGPAISDIVSGKTQQVKASTISAIARGLGVSEEEVFAIYRGKSPSDDPEYKNWQYAALFDDAKRLTPEQMTKFETIMEIARREVARMIEEQAHEPPRKKSKRA